MAHYTNAQLLAIKAAITANPTWNAYPLTDDGFTDLATQLNKLTSPAYIIWNESVSVTKTMVGAFDWTRVDNLSVGKARIIEWMDRAGLVNAGDTAVIAGINAAFSAVGDATSRQVIFNGMTRTAREVEKILATGAGTLPTNLGVGPSTVAVPGPISPDRVREARRAV
jgi:hypothetical protein